MSVSGSPPRFANDTRQRIMGHFYPSRMLWRTNGTAECWFKPINLIEAPATIQIVSPTRSGMQRERAMRAGGNEP